MIYCSKCVYPSVSVNLELTGGVCSACRAASEYNSISNSEWVNRENKFAELIDQYKKKSKSTYDCVIGVSGGKDSYFQTHKIVKDYGLKPLLVTYHGNNYLSDGEFNLHRMRDVFNVDHIIFGPGIENLRKLNRLGFRKMGDMNWHAHCGISTYPIQMAAMFKTPLVIWGEPSWDISGMYLPDDFVEFSARNRLEYSLRGFEWTNFLGEEGLTEQDLLWAKYPDDFQILSIGIRGIFIGNYFKWDPIQNTELMKSEYGWREYSGEFQRTYRKISNLDDRYENGAHDLLKFIKFGYGRASDHASKDIRAGRMTREQGIKLVQKYDHVVSDDLYYWLDYVQISEEEFWKIADSFRDPRVWWIKDNEWWKHNIWGDASAYGKTFLDSSAQEKYKRY